MTHPKRGEHSSLYLKFPSTWKNILKVDTSLLMVYKKSQDVPYLTPIQIPISQPGMDVNEHAIYIPLSLS